jgi:hypothetical protein
VQNDETNSPCGASVKDDERARHAVRACKMTKRAHTAAHTAAGRKMAP